MYGIWDGDRSHRFWAEQVFLTITPEGAWLDVHSPVNGGRVALTAEKVEKDGSVVFTFRPHAYQRPAQTFYTEPPKPILTSGRLLVKLERPAGRPAPYLAMRVAFSEREITSTTVLTQPEPPPEQDERFYIQGRRPLAYQDWRGRSGEAGGDPIAKLKTMLVRLDGRAPWMCHSQRQLMVKPGELTKFETVAPSASGFLIYAPNHPQGLTYFISTEPPIYGIIAGQQSDYPVIKTNPATLFHTGVTLSFYLRPTGSTPIPPAAVPVTVFTYSLASGDFKPQCTADDSALRPTVSSIDSVQPPPRAVAESRPAPATPVVSPVPETPAAVQPTTPSAASSYNGPRSGVLTCKGAPIVQNGEAVFTGLPPVPLRLTVDENIWDARLVPGDGNTQRLILRNKRPGRQSTCTVRWQVQEETAKN